MNTSFDAILRLAIAVMARTLLYRSGNATGNQQKTR